MKLQAAKAIIFLLVLSSTAFAQNFYKTYTLPAEGNTIQINCLYQLHNGYIFAGTTAGLYKFDGTSFQKIERDQKVSANVTAICEAKDGSIWIGFFDGKLGWLQNNKLVIQNPEEGLPAKPIKKIIQDSTGVIWIATAGEGIYYFKNNRYYNINTDDGLSDNYVYDLATNKLGLFASTDGGINKCVLNNDKKQITQFTSRNGLADNIVRALEPYRQPGNRESYSFYIGMQDAGLGEYHPEKQNAFNNYSQLPLPAWQFGQINDLCYSDNELFIATETNGLLCVRQNTIEPFNSSSKKITSLLKDVEGNIWAAGNDQLVRTNGTKLKPLIKLPAVEATNLHTLLLDKDKHIWFNVSSGLKHLSKDASGKWVEKIFTLPVSINSQITALYEDRFENIWIGTMGNGVFLLDAKTGKYRKITEDKLLQSASVLSITGKNNQVWVANLEGAARCELNDNNSNINSALQFDEFTSISGIGTNYIYSIFIDSKNRTWFATDGKGIAVYENGKITNYNHKQGLKSEVVYQITEDIHGNIWFTTFNAGLVKFDGKKLDHFGIAEGLSSMNITSLVADKFGNLYLGHKNGIDIINTQTNIVSYIDDEQGLENLNTDLNTITTDKDGDIYFVANGTIYKYFVATAMAQPKVIIDRIQLFLNDITVTSGHTFASDEDNISFYYTGLCYSQPGKIQYQYKLDGYGTEWITTSDRRRDFPKLPPGTYTFRVRASLNKNFQNAPEAVFTFTIQKPLWLRWWFIVLSALAIIAILYFFIRDRERRLQKWERLEKEKIQSQFETLRNQVNPHFLFNSFNTLISEIEDDPKRAVEYVEHMADFFRSIVTYREKDIIPLQEEIAIIKDYLFIQRKRYGNAFQVNIMISATEETEYFIAPLTLQLLAENAIKHNAVIKEKPLLLEVFIEAGQLVVRNNINQKLHREKSAGLGLQNIQKRYELLTKKTVMISDDDEYFTVIIPLIKKADGTGTDYRR